MNQDDVSALEQDVEAAIAEALGDRVSGQLAHLMAKAAVTVLEAAEERESASRG